MYDARPVPPLVPSNAEDNVKLFAVILTLTVELAVIVTDKELEERTPEEKHGMRRVFHPFYH